MRMLNYSSIIEPTFDYAITICGYTCDNNLHNIKRLQNIAARIVTGSYDYVTKAIEVDVCNSKARLVHVDFNV